MPSYLRFGDTGSLVPPRVRPIDAELHVLPRARRLIAALPRRIGVLHLLADARALLLVLQSRDQLGGAAVEGPRWNRRGEAGAAGHVGILIRGDVDPARPGGLDDRNCFLHAAEVFLTGHLEVEDVDL